MDWSDREAEILQWAADGPGIDSTARECDASQDELLDLIDKLESKLFDYNKLVLQERKWKLRWKRWAWWAWSINYGSHNPNKFHSLPTAVVRRSRAGIQAIIAASRKKK